MVLLSTAFCPPVDYFAVLAGSPRVCIEASEHYCKQSYRNRCVFLSPGGPESAVVPVVHSGDLFRTPITEVKVDYSTPWVRRFEYALESAYSSSPFFEYYRDGLFAILDSRPPKLWNLNSRITGYMVEKFGLCVDIAFTSGYVEAGTEGVRDFRDAIHPKRSPVLEVPAYWQVFGEKYGFVSGLSALDLLFNEGPEAACVLRAGAGTISANHNN